MFSVSMRRRSSSAISDMRFSSQLGLASPGGVRNADLEFQSPAPEGPSQRGSDTPAAVRPPGFSGGRHSRPLNAMKTGASPRSTLLVRADSRDGRRPGPMLHVGLDLSRTRLDVHAINEAGTPVLVTDAAPDAVGLASLVARVGEFG